MYVQVSENCVTSNVLDILFDLEIRHTHTHTYIYIYIYMFRSPTTAERRMFSKFSLTWKFATHTHTHTRTYIYIQVSDNYGTSNVLDILFDVKDIPNWEKPPVFVASGTSTTPISSQVQPCTHTH